MIDVILLTGFLGSGKTTCLNQLLLKLARQYDRVAVVMNEFGSIGIDGRLVDQGAVLVELQNGSIFCVCIRDNFLAAMANLAQESQPEVVVIEATGVADPFEMGDFVAYPGLQDIYRLDRIVTLVDAVNFPKVIQTLRAARAQAQAADVFIITKTDLLDPEAMPRLENLLKDINPTALRVTAPFCRLTDTEWDTVLGSAADRRGDRQPDRGVPARDPMVSITVAAGPFADSQTAEKVITSGLPPNALRAKGFVDIGGKLHLFQHTIGRTEIMEAELAGSAAKADAIGQLVIIGLNLQPSQIML
ncbi:MAG: GTP-binding protein [Firmicutes bacterium]|nr:GTP-binding protein [Bacillota bacterium]